MCGFPLRQCKDRKEKSKNKRNLLKFDKKFLKTGPLWFMGIKNATRRLRQGVSKGFGPSDKGPGSPAGSGGAFRIDELVELVAASDQPRRADCAQFALRHRSDRLADGAEQLLEQLFGHPRRGAEEEDLLAAGQRGRLPRHGRITLYTAGWHSKHLLVPRYAGGRGGV